jgi:hypothetical protein
MGRTVLAAAAGAAIAYLADPAMGRSRRTQLAQQAGAAIRRPARRAAHTIDVQRQQVANRATGLAHEMTSRDQPPPSDSALIDKIRSEVLGDAPWSGHVINVDAADGAVTLRGQVGDADEVARLEAAVRRIAGVQSVTNLLHPPGTDAPNIDPVLHGSPGSGQGQAGS